MQVMPVPLPLLPLCRCAVTRDAPFSMLVAMLARDPFVGRLATGRVHSGIARVGDKVHVLHHTGAPPGKAAPPARRGSKAGGETPELGSHFKGEEWEGVGRHGAQEQPTGGLAMLAVPCNHPVACAQCGTRLSIRPRDLYIVKIKCTTWIKVNGYNHRY